MRAGAAKEGKSDAAASSLYPLLHPVKTGGQGRPSGVAGGDRWVVVSAAVARGASGQDRAKG